MLCTTLVCDCKQIEIEMLDKSLVRTLEFSIELPTLVYRMPFTNNEVACCF